MGRLPAADGFDFGLGLATISHALVDFVLSLADEGIKEVVQRILACRLELVGLLVVAGLGAVVVMSLARRAGTRCSLWLAMGSAAIGGHGLRGRDGVAIEGGGVCSKGIGDGFFLRHDGSIERATGSGEGVGTQRAGCG